MAAIIAPMDGLTRILGLVSVAALAGCVSESSRYAGQLAGAEAPRLTVCHGFDCRNRTKVALDEAEQARLSGYFAGAGSATEERSAVSRAVAAFEEMGAARIGVRDQAKSHIGQSGDQGQMDCIDESTNTRTLLLHLAAKGLLDHHVVEHNRSRGLFVDGRYPHSTAVLRDSAGKRWAVDSWYEATGGPPDIMPLDEWMGRGVMGER